MVQARHWYEVAAAGGDLNAENSLARCLYLGLGGPKDRAQAIAHFKSAAERGDPHAALNLGKVLSDRESSPDDRLAAASWFTTARQGGMDIGDALDKLNQEINPRPKQAAANDASKMPAYH